jgi:hypothetical protein
VFNWYNTGNFYGENTVRRVLASLLVIFLLAACGTKTTPLPPEPTATTVPTATIQPTPSKPLAVLVMPSDMPATTAEQYEKVVYDLAQAEGYRFQLLNTLTAENLDPSLSIAIVLPPDPGIVQVASLAPQAHFLSVGIPGISAGANITVLGSGGTGPDLAPYLAGYISSMLAQDYRVGMIGEKDSENSNIAAASFSNARTFYCGLCQAVAPPWYEYPIIVNIPADTAENQMPAYADALRDRQVEVAYIYPSMSNPTLINYMSSLGILMLGEVTPPESARATWVASIQPDWLAAIQKAWPELVAGNGGVELPSPITLANVNSDLLSPGKERLATEMLNKLLNGTVGTKP